MTFCLDGSGWADQLNVDGIKIYILRRRGVLLLKDAQMYTFRGTTKVCYSGLYLVWFETLAGELTLCLSALPMHEINVLYFLGRCTQG